MNDTIASTIADDLAIIYDDDPDHLRAGQGLQSFPLINKAAGGSAVEYWMMAPSEQMGLLFILDQLRPKVAIEIGTKFGGSLQIMSHFCDKVYALDIDPDVPNRLKGKFPNVEYLIGPSGETLPPLIARLQKEGAELGFALVDGDHSTAGVKEDIDNLLKFIPTVPFYIIMHDSFNPHCRAGLKQANWAANPYVHAAELDFVPGTVNPTPAFRDQLWGGLAMGILLPHKRKGRFEVTARSERTYFAARAFYRAPALFNRGVRKVKRLFRGG
jgi:hypothetical protein